MSPQSAQIVSIYLFGLLLYFLSYLRQKKVRSNFVEMVSPAGFVVLVIGMLGITAIFAAFLGPSQLLLALDFGIGTTLSFVHPTIAVCFLVANLITRPWELLPPNALILLVPKLLAGTALTSWLFYSIRNRRHRLVWKSSIVVYLLFVGWLFLSAFASPDFYVAAQFLLDAFFPITVLSLLIVNSVSEERDIEVLRITLMTSVIAVLSSSIYLYFMQPEIGAFGGRLTGIGLASNPNDLGAIIVLAVPLAVIALFGRKMGLGCRMYHIVAVAILLFGLYATQSRGALLSLGGCGLVYLLTMVRLRKIAIVFLCAGIVVLYLLFSLIDREAGELEESREARWNYVVVGFKMLRAHPVFGIGPNGYPSNYERFSNLFVETGHRTAHSSWVLPMAESGAVGGLLFMTLFLMVMRTAYKLRRTRPEIFLSLVAYGIAMTFLSHTYLLFPYVLYSIVIASSVALRAERKRALKVAGTVAVTIFVLFSPLWTPYPALAEPPNRVSFEPIDYTPPLEAVEQYRSRMLSYGEHHWQQFAGRLMQVAQLDQKKPKWQDAPAFQQALADTYYDLAFVLYQIGDLTGQQQWYTRAKKALAFYRDQYVLPADGRIPGYWNFTHGLATDYLRTKDEASKRGVLLISKNAAYVRDDTPESEMIESAERSREIAYAIVAYLDAQRLGAPPRSRLKHYVELAQGHIKQWTGATKWIKVAEVDRERYVRPFMFALTARALIEYDESIGGSPEILKSIEGGADFIWDTLWRKGSRAFAYTDRVVDDPKDIEPSPDLNLLIAPLYGWLFHKTGEVKYRERGDEIFSGGVANAWMEGDSAKQFNQNYLWSVEYLKWRAPRKGRAG